MSVFFWINNIKARFNKILAAYFSLFPHMSIVDRVIYRVRRSITAIQP
jgi:hypothetical protein